MMEVYLEISGDLESNRDRKVVLGGALISDGARTVVPEGRRGILCCCCRRRRRLSIGMAAGEKQQSGKDQGHLPSAAPGAGDAHSEPVDAYSLLETPRAHLAGATRLPAPSQPLRESKCLPGDDEDFYDAQSDWEDEPNHAGGAWRSPTRPLASATAKRSAATHAMLQKLLGIERKCRGHGGPDAGAGESLGSADDVRVESVLSEDAAQMWFCHSAQCPFVIGCLRCILSGVHVQDAVEAIQCPSQRLSWDGDSYLSFELLRPHDAADPTREDVIFTVLPAPKPVRDREILQRRWQVAVGDNGGQALLMQSFEDDAIMAPDPKRIRAFTHLSGYILRPMPSRDGKATSALEVVVISQCDLGGALPGWFQNMARRLAKRRCVAWGSKLQAHCHARAACRLVGGRGAAEAV